MENHSNNSSDIIKEAVNHMLEQDPEYNKLREQYIFNNDQTGGSAEYNAYTEANVSNDVVNQLKETSTKSQEKSFNKVNKFARAMHKKYGSRDMDFGTVMEHSRRHSSKIGMSDTEFRMYEVLYQQLSDKDSGNFPANERNSQLGKTLGSVQAPFVSKEKSLKVASGDKQYVDEIIRIASLNRQQHAQCMLQADAYTPHGMHDVLIQARFIPGLQNRSCAVHPLLVALFGPKIVSLDDRMIKTNLAGIIRDRLLGEPIRTKNDFELFIDLTTDQQESVCDSGSVFADILKRVKIQETLRRSIWQMRGGQFFECNTQGLISSLEDCQLSQTDSPHLMYIRDEGTMLRRLLSAFSFKPTHVTTRPVYSMTGLVPPIQKLDQLSMINVVLPHANLTNTQNDESPATDIMSGLNVPHWYLENGVVIPKQQQIVYSREVIFFYVNRRYQSIHSMYNSTYQFQRLPVATGGFDKLNTHPVNWNPIYPIHQSNYYLRSVLCMRPLNWTQQYEGQSGGAAHTPRANTDVNNYHNVYNGCYTILVEPGNHYKTNSHHPGSHGTGALGSIEATENRSDINIWIYDPNLLVLNGPGGRRVQAGGHDGLDTSTAFMQQVESFAAEQLRGSLNAIKDNTTFKLIVKMKNAFSEITDRHGEATVEVGGGAAGTIDEIVAIAAGHPASDAIKVALVEIAAVRTTLSQMTAAVSETDAKNLIINIQAAINMIVTTPAQITGLSSGERTAISRLISTEINLNDKKMFADDVPTIHTDYLVPVACDGFDTKFPDILATPGIRALGGFSSTIHDSGTSLAVLNSQFDAGGNAAYNFAVISKQIFKLWNTTIGAYNTANYGHQLGGSNETSSNIDGLLRTRFGSSSNVNGQLTGVRPPNPPGTGDKDHNGMTWEDVVSSYGTIFIYSQVMTNVHNLGLDSHTKSLIGQTYIPNDKGGERK